MDTTTCPECGGLAEVQWRDVLESTDGPVEHAKIRCVRWHWFLLPVAQLEQPTATPRPTPVGAGPGPLTARAGGATPPPVRRAARRR